MKKILILLVSIIFIVLIACNRKSDSNIGFEMIDSGSNNATANPITLLAEYFASKSVQASSHAMRQDIVSAPPPPSLQVFELPPFSKNTADLEPRFLKMTIALGYDSNLQLSSELTTRREDIQHIINLILDGKSFEDLNSTARTLNLAEEIKANINISLTAGKIKEVYFTEFVLN